MGNLGIHEGLARARTGEVLVVHGFANPSRALIGELIAGRAHDSGLAGFVSDGAIRDVAAIEELGLPVFARAVTPAGPFKMGPYRHQVPVTIGGQCVLPGDVIVADADGVVVIPFTDLSATVAAAEDIHDIEIGKRLALASQGSPSSAPPAS